MSRPFACAFVALTLAAAALPAAAQQTVQRRLIYDFSVGVQNDTRDTNSAVSNSGGPNGGSYSGTGDTSYLGVASDMGTIDVDIYGVEPDGGLVLKVGENGRSNRNNAAVECVVYPTTNVVCGQGVVTPEEMAIIRTLSPKFFDPSALDAKRHWHEGSATAGVSLDFTAGVPNGTLIPITAEDNEQLPHDGTLHATATYTYDMGKTVTTQVKDYETLRRQNGPGEYADIVFDITATLATDSQTAKN